MGKPRRPKGQNKSKKGEARSDHRDNQPRGSAAINKSNAAFEAYYKAQAILDTDEEFDRMMSSYREDLHTTFRVTGSRAHAQDLNNMIKRTYVPYLSGISYEGQPLPPPESIPWYPGGLAWQINVPKNIIRRSPEFKKFQEFLVYETEAGNLSRQEAVSMIPPLLLDVKPHHYVLDMCAAPGSKSVQILEALHTNANGNESLPPPGLFIANDADAKRCHMLVHQSLGRIGSPNMMVTNQDASMFMGIKIGSQGGKVETLKFDRILADVPCSGDGTLRKNLPIWKDWHSGDGNGLHPLQLRILLRGIQYLKAGGRLVYSTCSMNPVENEAVVSAALSSHPDLSLVDVSEQLPELKRKPGMTEWKVFNKEQKELEKGSATWQMEGAGNKRPPGTLWPAGDEKTKNISRCLRLYPHLQDTGGFFVAVLQKAPESVAQPDAALGSGAAAASVEEKHSTAVPSDTTLAVSNEERPAKRAKVETAEETAIAGSSTTQQQQGQKKKEKGTGLPFKEEPYTYLSPDNAEVQSISSFFRLKAEFDVNNLMVRNREGEAKRSIYATSSSVRHVIQHNDYTRIRLISAGVRCFTRQDGGQQHGLYPCKWRIVNEGVSYLRRYIGEDRVVQGGLKELEALLKELYPTTESVGKDFQDQLMKLEPGSCVLEFGPELEAGIEQAMFLPMWKAPVTVNMMVEKNEKSALALRVFGHDITGLIERKKQKTGQHEQRDGRMVEIEDQDMGIAET